MLPIAIGFQINFRITFRFNFRLHFGVGFRTIFGLIFRHSLGDFSPHFVGWGLLTTFRSGLRLILDSFFGHIFGHIFDQKPGQKRARKRVQKLIQKATRKWSTRWLEKWFAKRTASDNFWVNLGNRAVINIFKFTFVLTSSPDLNSINIFNLSGAHRSKWITCTNLGRRCTA